MENYLVMLGTRQVPTVFFNGGPASDSHQTFEAMKEKISNTNLPFVFIDQRGTGCSDPYPSVVSADTAERLSFYGSSAIVRDAESVRRTLVGNSRWKAFGQSYGGWIVHRYLEQSSSSLEAAFSHGAAIDSGGVSWMASRLFSQKRVSDEYFRVHPEDRAVLEKVRKLIPNDLCFNDDSTRICGPGLIDALVGYLGFKESWGTLHQWIQAANTEDVSHITKTWAKEVVENVFFPFFAWPHGFARAVISEVENYSGDTPEEGTCVAVTRRLEQQGEKPNSWPFNECRIATEYKWSRAVMDLKKKDPFNLNAVKAALSEQATLPFFLYASRNDSFVPLETFTHSLNVLGDRVTYRLFETSGHEGFYTEDRIWDDLKTAIRR